MTQPAGFSDVGQYNYTGTSTSEVEPGGVITITATGSGSLELWYRPVRVDADEAIALEEGDRVVVAPDGGGGYTVSVVPKNP